MLNILYASLMIYTVVYTDSLSSYGLLCDRNKFPLAKLRHSFWQK